MCDVIENSAARVVRQQSSYSILEAGASVHPPDRSSLNVDVDVVSQVAIRRWSVPSTTSLVKRSKLQPWKANVTCESFACSFARTSDPERRTVLQLLAA